MSAHEEFDRAEYNRTETKHKNADGATSAVIRKVAENKGIFECKKNLNDVLWAIKKGGSDDDLCGEYSPRDDHKAGCQTCNRVHKDTL